MSPEAQLLLVEDELLVRRSIARLLRLRGFSVTDVGSAAEALAALAEGPCDILVTDVVLSSSETGVDIARAARQSVGQQLPVVFISGYPKDREGELASFLDDDSVFLPKPYRMSEFMAVVNGLLDRSKGRAPA